MCIAVTITALRRWLAALRRLGMRAMCPCLLRISMAIGALDLLWRRLVHRPLDILVAVNTGKEAAMDGMLQLFLIHKERELVAILFLAQ